MIVDRARFRQTILMSELRCDSGGNLQSLTKAEMKDSKIANILDTLLMDLHLIAASKQLNLTSIAGKHCR